MLSSYVFWNSSSENGGRSNRPVLVDRNVSAGASAACSRVDDDAEDWLYWSATVCDDTLSTEADDDGPVFSLLAKVCARSRGAADVKNASLASPDAEF